VAASHRKKQFVERMSAPILTRWWYVGEGGMRVWNHVNGDDAMLSLSAKARPMVLSNATSFNASRILVPRISFLGQSMCVCILVSRFSGKLQASTRTAPKEPLLIGFESHCSAWCMAELCCTRSLQKWMCWMNHVTPGLTNPTTLAFDGTGSAGFHACTIMLE
jgi:hypothetical protein